MCTYCHWACLSCWRLQVGYSPAAPGHSPIVIAADAGGGGGGGGDGGGAALQVRDGGGGLIYTWGAEFGRLRYELPKRQGQQGPGMGGGSSIHSLGEVLELFLVLGSRLRWRLTVRRSCAPPPRHFVQPPKQLGRLIGWKSPA
jgi:hypothetical protein